MSDRVAQRVATRFRTAYSAASTLLREAVAVHEAMQAWAGRFPELLRMAVREADGLPARWVWQTQFVPFFDGFERFETQLQDLNDATFDAPSPALSEATELPPRARITFAIADFQFFPDPRTGQDEIAYDVDTLKQWAAAFNRWTTQAVRLLQVEIRRTN